MQYLMSEPGGSPPQQRGGMMDRTAGAHMVAGILAALLHREKTGEGQALEFSLYHTAVWTLAADLQVVLGGQPLLQNDRTKVVNPLWNSYRTKDDRWLQLAMLQSDLSWPNFCLALERPQLEDDPRFNSIENRAEHCEELIQMLNDIFASENVTDWERRLRETDCIFGRVQTPQEVIDDPQAIANGFFAEMDHPEEGQTSVVTTPVTFRQNPATVRTASPEAGQHTEEILLELGYSWDDISRLKNQKAIL
jgi:crotonobetainyl-CoA:carnitine CoA-transferase CaiB-like acyl-CoA transferase